MLPLRCLAPLAVLLATASVIVAQEERKVFLFAAAGDEQNNQDLQGKAIASLVLDRDSREPVEFAKTLRIDGDPPKAGSYYRLGVTFTIAKKARASDLYFSEDLPRGTRVMAVKHVGKFQASISKIGGKTLVKDRKVDLVSYEATVLLPRPK
jgi:hypothetical protein